MDIKQKVMESKNGNIDSFIELLTAKQDTLFKIAFTYSQNPYDAEDSLSEASIKAFDKIKQLREPEKFYKWYTTLLINLCRARYKRQKRELENIDRSIRTDLMERVAPDFSEAVENKLLVEKIFQSLKHDERDLLVLRFMDDYTIKEIAEIMQVAEGTIKSRLYRTLKKIKISFGGNINV